jgi:hypothetical protein
MSSILENAGNLFNRGVAAAERGTKSLSLKSQINDLNRQREKLTSDLGASIYQETRYDTTFRASREGFYSAIESVDAQIATIQDELTALEQEAQAAANQPMTVQPVVPAEHKCPSCGAIAQSSDAFCRSCGTAIPAAAAPVAAAPATAPGAPGAPSAPVSYPDASTAIASEAPPAASQATETAGTTTAAPSADAAPFVSTPSPAEAPSSAQQTPFVSAPTTVSYEVPTSDDAIEAEIINIEPIAEESEASE